MLTNIRTDLFRVYEPVATLRSYDEIEFPKLQSPSFGFVEKVEEDSEEKPSSTLTSLVVPDPRTQTSTNSPYRSTIIVDKKTLNMEYYDDLGNLKFKSRVSTGKNSGLKQKVGDMRTPEGTFTISGFENRTDKYARDNFGKQPWVYRLNTPGWTGILFHGDANEPDKIGTPASKGCIRLPNDKLEELHNILGEDNNALNKLKVIIKKQGGNMRLVSKNPVQRFKLGRRILYAQPGAPLPTLKLRGRINNLNWNQSWKNRNIDNDFEAELKRFNETLGENKFNLDNTKGFQNLLRKYSEEVGQSLGNYGDTFSDGKWGTESQSYYDLLANEFKNKQKPILQAQPAAPQKPTLLQMRRDYNGLGTFFSKQHAVRDLGFNDYSSMVDYVNKNANSAFSQAMRARFGNDTRDWNIADVEGALGVHGKYRRGRFGDFADIQRNLGSWVGTQSGKLANMTEEQWNPKPQPAQQANTQSTNNGGFNFNNFMTQMSQQSWFKPWLTSYNNAQNTNNTENNTPKTTQQTLPSNSEKVIELPEVTVLAPVKPLSKNMTNMYNRIFNQNGNPTFDLYNSWKNNNWKLYKNGGLISKDPVEQFKQGGHILKYAGAGKLIKAGINAAKTAAKNVGKTTKNASKTVAERVTRKAADKAILKAKTTTLNNSTRFAAEKAAATAEGNAKINRFYGKGKKGVAPYETAGDKTIYLIKHKDGSMTAHFFDDKGKKVEIETSPQYLGRIAREKAAKAAKETKARGYYENKLAKANAVNKIYNGLLEGRTSVQTAERNALNRMQQVNQRYENFVRARYAGNLMRGGKKGLIGAGIAGTAVGLPLLFGGSSSQNPEENIQGQVMNIINPVGTARVHDYLPGVVEYSETPDGKAVVRYAEGVDDDRNWYYVNEGTTGYDRNGNYNIYRNGKWESLDLDSMRQASNGLMYDKDGNVYGNEIKGNYFDTLAKAFNLDRDAVRRFLKEHGLKVDGLFGRKTLLAYLKAQKEQQPSSEEYRWNPGQNNFQIYQ